MDDPTDQEKTIINARHEAWHCAAAIESGVKVQRIQLTPEPRTFWGEEGEVIDDQTQAVILLVPNIVMPDSPSRVDQDLLDHLDPKAVERARAQAIHLVNEEISVSGVDVVARLQLALGWCPGGFSNQGVPRR